MVSTKKGVSGAVGNETNKNKEKQERCLQVLSQKSTESIYYVLFKNFDKEKSNNGTSNTRN